MIRGDAQTDCCGKCKAILGPADCACGAQPLVMELVSIFWLPRTRVTVHMHVCICLGSRSDPLTGSFSCKGDQKQLQRVGHCLQGMNLMPMFLSPVVMWCLHVIMWCLHDVMPVCNPYPLNSGSSSWPLSAQLFSILYLESVDTLWGFFSSALLLTIPSSFLFSPLYLLPVSFSLLPTFLCQSLPILVPPPLS